MINATWAIVYILHMLAQIKYSIFVYFYSTNQAHAIKKQSTMGMAATFVVNTND